MPRTRLPNRRGGFNIDFECRGNLYTALLGFNRQNELRDVFLRSGKVGTEVNIVMMEAALLLSFYLQHGGTVEEVRNAMPRTHKGKPEGPIGTLLDLYTRELSADVRKDLLS